ncbi:hypothetical protein FJZ31_21110 [Candidatus Poribacteria bacterium]|nr:hypothetical protein [Candidatus Poribacteria bacterium]
MTKRFSFPIVISFLFAFASLAVASDLALYTGPTNPGWISPVAVEVTADMIMKDPKIKSTYKKIDNFGDGDEVGDSSPLAKWTKAHTGNKEIDVIVLVCGTTPSGLYPFPNKQPDGSNVEKFIEDGNILINIADWIFYMSYEGGVRSADNGPSGAANVFDIPGLSFGSRNNNMKVNANGKKYLPSLTDFTSDRPWHLEQFKGTDWEVTTFAEAGANDADPAVAVNKKYGGIIAALMQKAAPTWPEGDEHRAKVLIEFMNNWLLEHAELKPVDSKDKLTTTWGEIKSQ